MIYHLNKTITFDKKSENVKKLISLPPHMVDYLRRKNDPAFSDCFFTSDPKDKKLGSGGGTAWLLKENKEFEDAESDVFEWLSREKRILIHAGGQSRRLPAYAPTGKVFIPIPVFRWARGQKINQTLLSLQLPLYEKIMEDVPDNLHTLIASGDVYIHNTGKIPKIPQADIVCCGIWVDGETAGRHGVFFFDRKSSFALDFMLQKPDAETLQQLSQTHYFMLDIGLWLLSDKAITLLMKKSGYEKEGDEIHFYDLYSQFGPAMGNHPHIVDPEINALKVAILPLHDAQFYHYGTAKELISSTLSLQNQTHNQKFILHKKIKPHPAIFVQNSRIDYPFTVENSDIWVENSCIGNHWQINKKHILTGIPPNDWLLAIPESICIDAVPVGDNKYVIRPYGFEDKFSGSIHDSETHWMGRPAKEWFVKKGIPASDDLLHRTDDIQFARLFPVCAGQEEMISVLQWMITENEDRDGNEEKVGREIWLKNKRLSADEISSQADIQKIMDSREKLLNENRVALSRNYTKSVFYQTDLEEQAHAFAKNRLPLPPPLPSDSDLLMQMHNRMFRSRVLELEELPFQDEREKAFSLLRKGFIEISDARKIHPKLNVHPDQIVWARSPVRIDLAGGWTDTPPYCLMEGGNVVNIAVELNGQPPIQVYVKPSEELAITLRSIDLGATEVVADYPSLEEFHTVGSPFSIPKAALALCGFSPQFSEKDYPSLQDQLRQLGCGIELTLLSAIPAGSGLGTSSILAATVLGALSDFFGLQWSKNDIGKQTLLLEQLLTTGGGWQDQYGGVLHGVKLLRTHEGFDQEPVASWLPDDLFTSPQYRDCHLLYYTGITRTAKHILQDIVAGMLLNKSETLALLADMKLHALDTAEIIQLGNFDDLGWCVATTWEQKQRLDKGTNPPAIEKIIALVKDYTLGFELPGAGGGGYIYLIAKDAEAAVDIKRILHENPPNNKARFVEMSISHTGMQITRS